MADARHFLSALESTEEQIQSGLFVLLERRHFTSDFQEMVTNLFSEKQKTLFFVHFASKYCSLMTMMTVEDKYFDAKLDVLCLRYTRFLKRSLCGKVKARSSVRASVLSTGIMNRRQAKGENLCQEVPLPRSFYSFSRTSGHFERFKGLISGRALAAWEWDAARLQYHFNVKPTRMRRSLPGLFIFSLILRNTWTTQACNLLPVSI